MSDPYIDQWETLAYGDFAVRQIAAVVVGLDKDFDKAIETAARRLKKATSAMHDVLAKTDGVTKVSYAEVKGTDGDARAAAIDVLDRLAAYAGSRKNGKPLRAKILGGDTVTALKRRRPAKLLAALDVATRVVDTEKSQLPEWKSWHAELVAARGALAAFDDRVRTSRVARSAMTPEVTAARADWLRVYGAAKLVVEGVLRLHGKESLLSQVFDDLAEVHRALGVADQKPATEATASTAAAAG